MMLEPPSDTELGAYLDRELDLADQLRIESYLAAHPAAAAELIEQSRIRTALRLLSGSEVRTSTRSTYAPPVRLRRGRFPAKGTAWAAAGLVAAAVAVQSASLFASTPDYVSEAVMAHRTGLIRAGMSSQLETTVLDAREILSSMRIRVPLLPPGWRITDVQVFPSDEGPALQIMVRTPDRKEVSIFAVRAHSSAPLAPVAVRRGKESVAYWRNQDMSYALTGADAPEAIDLAAEDLADERS